MTREASLKAQATRKLRASLNQSSRIVLVGIELEGGYDRQIEHREWLTGDGSVHAEGSYYVGECVLPPRKLVDAIELVKENFPDHANDTCGMHIHLSFDNKISYGKLKTPEFYNYFLVRLEQWGSKNQIYAKSPFWKRLREGNNYCQKGFNAERQLKATSKDRARYYHLNYCYNFGGMLMPRKTLEVRILPMFKKKTLAISAITEVVNIFNEWLNDPRQDFQDVSFDLVDTEDELNMEMIV